MAREFEYYENANGRKVVEEEIANARLSPVEAERLELAIEKLETGRDQNSRLLRGRIWEIKISGDRRALRLLWAKLDARQVALGLVFLDKKTQKCPPKVIRLAERRLRDANLAAGGHSGARR